MIGIKRLLTSLFLMLASSAGNAATLAASSPTPAALPATYSFVSNSTGVGYEALQEFPLTAGSDVCSVTVPGRVGGVEFKVVFYDKADGAPARDINGRVGITPTVTNVSADLSTYTLDFSSNCLQLPAGDFYLSVVETSGFEWAWYGEAGAGYWTDGTISEFRPGAAPTASELGYEIEGDAYSTNANHRTYHTGDDTKGWAKGQVGKPGSWFNRGVSHSRLDPESAAIITYLNDRVGANFFDIGFGKAANSELFVSHVCEADASTPTYEWSPRLQYLHPGQLPEDEHINGHGDRIAMPYPSQGRLDDATRSCRVQNSAGVTCDGSDCHLYVIDLGNDLLWEQYKSYSPGTAAGYPTYSAGVTRKYDLSSAIDNHDEDLYCTSANAAGVSYIPGIVDAGEVAAGKINHRILFTLPNNWVARNEFWGPATHNPLRNGSADGGAGRPFPYGATLRLNNAYPLTGNADVDVWIVALKEFGMTHVDGSFPGQLVGSNDYLSNAPWVMGPADLRTIGALQISDFEVVQTTRKNSMSDGECSRRSINNF